MKHLVVSLLFVFACGGKQPAKTTQPTETESDGPGIRGEDVPVRACYEECYGTGPAGATDWANKTEEEKQAACNASCASAAEAPADATK